MMRCLQKSLLVVAILLAIFSQPVLAPHCEWSELAGYCPSDGDGCAWDDSAGTCW
jgi:hypothetical protein